MFMVGYLMGKPETFGQRFFSVYIGACMLLNGMSKTITNTDTFEIQILGGLVIALGMAGWQEDEENAKLKTNARRNN